MPPAQWKTIADFSPGIHDFIGPNHPPGTASRGGAGTHGCFSPFQGVLAPLPRIAQLIPAPTVADPDPTHNLAEEFRIAGLHTVGPTVGVGNTEGADTNQTQIFIAVSYYTATGTPDDQQLEWFRYERNLATPVWTSIHPESRDLLTDFNLADNPVAAEMVSLRTNDAAPSSVGPIVTAFMCVGTSFMFPDETAPTVDGTDWLMGDKVNDPDFVAFPGPGGTNIVGHQGRLVYFYSTLNGGGTNTIWATNEQFFWSAPNAINTLSPLLVLSGGKFNITAQYADPTGYEAMASLTANELFLLKSRGGAIVLRGDLDDPTIISYPYVRSPGNSNNNGTASPRGYLYPVDGSGVWSWTGGQVSQHMTPHLEADFWKPPTIAASTGLPTAFDSYPTKCCQAGDLVFFPGNWVFDANTPDNQPTSGWWLLEDNVATPGATIHRWSVDWRGQYLYGTPSGFQHASDPLIAEYRLDSPRSTFGWTSHPMAETMDKEVRLSEMVVVAAGVGTVTVRAYTGEDPEGQTVSFLIGGPPQTPTFTRQNISVQGTELTFEVLSEATDDDDPAPTIHQIRYAVSESNRISNVGGPE